MVEKTPNSYIINQKDWGSGYGKQRLSQSANEYIENFQLNLSCTDNFVHVALSLLFLKICGNWFGEIASFLTAFQGIFGMSFNNSQFKDISENGSEKKVVQCLDSSKF